MDANFIFHNKLDIARRAATVFLSSSKYCATLAGYMQEGSSVSKRPHRA